MHVIADGAIKANRVLVLEDENIIAMLLAEVLKGMGHSVSEIVASEADALAAAARCRPDLMIVDARLRHGSGVSAVKEIIRTGFVPHVFVSGDNLRSQALWPGAVVINKPYRDVELARAIQCVLSAAPLRTNARNH
nr:response regulator [Plastoroseomonas hellenica]